MPERKHNLSFQQGKIWVTSDRKGGGEMRARGTKQSLSSFCWSRKHRAAAAPAALAQTANNKHDQRPVSPRLIETKIYGLGKLCPALEKEVEHRQDFQTTPIIGSRRPDRTARPQRSPLGSTTFASDPVPLSVAPETTQGLNLPINI